MTVAISFSMEEKISYLFSNIAVFSVVITIVVLTLIFHKPKFEIFKKQYNELLKNEEKYKYYIILHDNFKKFNKKWNIIFSINFIIPILLVINNIINEYINSGYITYGAIFIFLFSSIIILIPSLIWFMISYVKFRKNEHKIESNIDKFVTNN